MQCVAVYHHTLVELPTLHVGSPMPRGRGFWLGAVVASCSPLALGRVAKGATYGRRA